MLLHELFSILDNEGSADYVFPPDTGKIIYMNRQAVEYTPSVREGDTIFKSMCGRNGYCQYCRELEGKLSEIPIRVSNEALCSYANVTFAIYPTEKGPLIVSRWDENAAAGSEYETTIQENAGGDRQSVDMVQDETVYDIIELKPDSDPKDDNKDIVADCGMIELEPALTALGNEREIYDSIARTYYDDGLQKITKIREYFEEGDLENLRIAVHGLKSASYIIGANALAELSKRLEYACRDIVDADKDYGDIPRSTPDEAQDILNNNILVLLNDFNALLKVYARYFDDDEGMEKLEKESD